MIPDEAVEAAADKLQEIAPRAAGEIPLWALLQALEAAAPHLTTPRTITTAEQLEALPFGSAVQTSDDSDVVVLRCEGNNFRNQSGADLSATDLWRYGTKPFTVIYEPRP